MSCSRKGTSAIERSERGIVLMILKEETLPSVTEVNLYTADDIPKELSDSNREQLNWRPGLCEQPEEGHRRNHQQ